MTTLQSLRTQLCAITGALLLGATATQAQLPMSYQGMITTIATNQPASGSYTMTFRLYTSPTGGTPIWQETQSNILLNQGIFNVQLGATAPLKLPFGEQYYLGVSISDGTEMEPRTALTSVPYAYRATTSDSALTVADGAITLAKIDTAGSSFGQVLTRTMNGLAWLKPLTPVKTMAATLTDGTTILGTGITGDEIRINYPQTYTNPSGTAIGSPLWNMINQYAYEGAGRFEVDNNDNDATALVALTNSDEGDAGSFTLNNVYGTGNALTASSNGTTGSTALYIPSGAILAAGTVGATPTSGAGTRLMWIPEKAAFRAGIIPNVPSTAWDNTNIGAHSMATGYSTIASGESSTALGHRSVASGYAATAMGDTAFASGTAATAMGYYTLASGNYSIAAGYQTEASGIASTALGEGTQATAQGATALGGGTDATATYATAAGSASQATANSATAMGSGAVASGSAATALGSSVTASGTAAFAVGSNTTASGNYSTALGSKASTNSHQGSLVYGDLSSAFVVDATADNQVTMRAANGYQLHTDANLTTGLRLGNNGSLLMEGTNATLPLVTGNGNRMMWIPGKEGAIRAGIIDDPTGPATQWDDANTGNASVAMGRNTIATGNTATAFGDSTVASGAISTAIGSHTRATGSASTAMGYKTLASAIYSTAIGEESEATDHGAIAMGYRAHASGTISTAIGTTADASGNQSIAIGTGSNATGQNAIALGNSDATGSASISMGNFTTASGQGATAMGLATAASGDYSTATGQYASTNGMSGGFVFGDGSTTSLFNASGANRFEVRTDRVWFGTNNTIAYPTGSFLATSTGAYLTSGGTWTNSSDRNRKTDIQTLNCRTVLDRVVSMPITSWRYIADEASIRHIGPMAQDFQRFFKLSEDSTHIATVDADGVALASIKGLYEVMQEKDSALDALHSKVAVQGNSLLELQHENAEMRQENNQLRERLERIEQLLLNNKDENPMPTQQP